MSVPIVAITMGDAAGVGSEIIVKALCEPQVYEWVRPFVVGDKKRLELALKICGLEDKAHVKAITEEDLKKGLEYRCGEILCFDMDLIPEDLPFGQLSAIAGDASYRYLEKAIYLTLDHKCHAICTAPLNKEAMHMGGHMYPGHTEILAELSGTRNFSMMFVSPELSVILVTIHVGLIEAVEMINPELVYITIKQADDFMKRAGFKSPRIAVCGINPHAGENGLFGNREEETKILPAVEKAIAEGINVSGPLPADTAFFRARRGDFDVVVSMLHDQGLGPMKVLDMDRSVNVTVGLPFVRTSVDHGTAFDVAGTGKATYVNMLEAIRQAGILTGPVED